MYSSKMRYILAVLLVGNVFLAATTVYYNASSRRNWDNLVAHRIMNGKMTAELGELQKKVEMLQKQLSSGSENRKIERLQRDLEKLNEVLEMREQEIGQLQAKEAGKADAVSRNRKPVQRKTYQEYMEQLKKDNPERYQKIKNRMEEMALRKKKMVEKRERYFSALDKTKLTSEQQTMVSDYLTLIQLNDDLIEENNSENRKEIWQNNRLLMNMQEGIREVLLQQETGDSGKAERIKEIYEITSPRAVFGSMGHFR